MKKQFFTIGLIFLLILTTLIPISLGYYVKFSDNIKQQPLLIAAEEYSPHEPIYIDGNIGFVIGLNGIVSGKGTSGEPYLISGWEINASNADGIHIRNSDVYFIIDYCYIHNGGLNHSGIVFYNVINGELNKTKIIENRVGVNLGINCKKITISNSSILYNYYEGVVSKGSIINIIDNNISYNINEGIHLYSIESINNDNIVNGNIISDNKNAGISVNKVYNTTFVYNIISENIIGIAFIDSADNVIINNNILSNLDSGVYLYSSNNNNIFENYIFNNGQGLELIYSNNNSLFKNIINSNKHYNIWCYGWSNSNTITLNNISNSGIGIFLPEARYNKILQNNLINNKVNVIFESSPNTWNENYWGRPMLFPKLIFGIVIILLIISIPWINVDWNPAREPYDI